MTLLIQICLILVCIGSIIIILNSESNTSAIISTVFHASLCLVIASFLILHANRIVILGTIILIHEWLPLVYDYLKERVMVRENFIEIEATCVSYQIEKSDSYRSLSNWYYIPIYEYYIYNKHLIAVSRYNYGYFTGHLLPKIGTKAMIFVNPNDPEESYVFVAKDVRLYQYIGIIICLVIGCITII